MVKLYFGLILVFCSTALLGQSPTIIVTNDDLKSATYHWSNDTIYLLDGLVYLENGGTLNIEAGTTIKGKESPSNGDPTSALIITVGAVINAEGKYLDPIVFTTELDNRTDPDDLTALDQGLWGGLLILGDAPVLDADSTHITIPYPGLNSTYALFGGSHVDHNAGTLNFVSIRHAGANGMASFSLAGVGKGTMIDYVEVFAGADRGIEFLGGNNYSKHLSSAFNVGDAFVWDQGYQGKSQFWFSIQHPNGAGHAISAKGAYSNPTIYNATLLGPGINAPVPTETAIAFSEGAGGTLGMSVIAEYPHFGIFVEDLPGNRDSYANLSTGKLQLISNIWGDLGASENDSLAVKLIAPTAEDPNAQLLTNLIYESNSINHDIFDQISRTPDLMMRPGEFSDVDFSIFDETVYPEDSFFTRNIEFVCIGRGAFIEGNAWWLRHWTALYDDQFLQHPCIPSFISSLALDSDIQTDTIILSCEEVNNLPADFEYLCLNYKCKLLNQGLSVAMRMRRKRPKGLIGGSLPANCYIEELIFQGVELAWGDNTALDSIGVPIDTFEITIIALVIDTTPPILDLIPCTICSDFPFSVQVTDCDTAWISAEFHDSIWVDSAWRIEHSWIASDSCGNTSTLFLEEFLADSSRLWFRDQDGDGFGIEDQFIAWSGVLPGYSNDAGDCDDLAALIHPDRTENWLNAYDDNCDGLGNIDLCALASKIPVLSSCINVRYGTEGASLDTTAQFSGCVYLSEIFETDIWLKVAVPPSNTIRIDMTIAGAPQYDFPSVDLFSGQCGNLQMLQCTTFSKEGELLTLSLTDVEEDTIMLRIGKEIQTAHTFDICVYDPLETKTIESNVIANVRYIGFPNPTHDLHTIDLYVRRKMAVDLTVFDLYGRIVKQVLEAQKLDVGDHRYQISIKEPPGVYYVQLRTQDGIFTYPLLINP